MRIIRVLVAVGFVALATPATAASPQVHCAWVLEPIARDGTTIEAELVDAGCYGSLAEAVAAGSGGSIEIAPEVTVATLQEADLQSSAAASTVLIGTEYVDATYGGSSNSYFASQTCSSSTDWEVAYVTNTWNDVFSSGKGFGGCDRNRKFAGSNFGGASILCTPNCSYYGTLSDEVSSLRWRP